MPKSDIKYIIITIIICLTFKSICTSYFKNKNLKRTIEFMKFSIKEVAKVNTRLYNIIKNKKDEND